MERPYLTPWKRFTVPVYEAVDISDCKAVLNTPEFQRLRLVRQLGTAFLTFPGANHSRFEHSLGVMAQARKYARSLNWREMLDEEDVRVVELAGLLHDIGHGPFSHLTEKVATEYGSVFANHNEHTDYIISERLRDKIDSVSDTEKVRAVVNKQHPLSALISHKTLGADKVAYVRVDQYHTGFPPNPLNIGDLAENLVFLNGALGVDERMARNVMRIQRHYFDMYTEVYLRKGVRTSERFVERAIQEAAEQGAVDLDAMWGWSDEQLLHRLIDSEAVPWFSLDSFCRFWKYRVAVAMRMPGHEGNEVIRGKDIASVPIAKENFFEWYADIGNVARAERAVAKELGVPSEEVLFTLSLDPQRLMPQDVDIYSPHGEHQGTLFGNWPDFYKMLVELADNCAAGRICVREAHRKRACEAAPTLAGIVEGLIG